MDLSDDDTPNPLVARDEGDSDEDFKPKPKPVKAKPAAKKAAPKVPTPKASPKVSFLFIEFSYFEVLISIL